VSWHHVGGVSYPRISEEKSMISVPKPDKPIGPGASTDWAFRLKGTHPVRVMRFKRPVTVDEALDYMVKYDELEWPWQSYDIWAVNDAMETPPFEDQMRVTVAQEGRGDMKDIFDRLEEGDEPPQFIKDSYARAAESRKKKAGLTMLAHIIAATELWSQIEDDEDSVWFWDYAAQPMDNLQWLTVKVKQLNREGHAEATKMAKRLLKVR